MDPENGNGNHNENENSETAISDEMKDRLKELVQLNPDQEEQLSSLPEEDQERWFRVVRSWSDPETRLMAIDDEIARQRQPVPTFHVPTAEGVASYRGLFGGNGGLSRDQKEQVRRLLQRAAEASDDEDAAEE
jgi:hypothetical protein